MDGIKNNRVAKKDERNTSDRYRLPRSKWLPGQNVVNKSSFFQPENMVSDTRSCGHPERISSAFDFQTDRKLSFVSLCNSYGDELKDADSSQNERRSKGSQYHPEYVPSAYDLYTSEKAPSAQISNHDKRSVDRIKSYSRRLSRFSSQTCEATMSAITSSSAGKERIKSPSKRNRYCYQLQHSGEETEENVSSGNDLLTCESRTMAEYENLSSPKQQFRIWLPPCRPSNHFSYHSQDEISSIKTWPTHQQNRHSQTRKLSRYLAPKIQEECSQMKRVARQRLEQSTGVSKQPFSVLPEENAVQGARSRGQIQVSNITSQRKGGCCLPPVEIVTDYSCGSKEEQLPSGFKLSPNKAQPYTIEEEMPQDRKYANLQQQRPKPSAVHMTFGGQMGTNCSAKRDCLANQSTVISEDPFQPLTEGHKEQFLDEIRGPRLSKRRNAVCSELEKETNRVKINGLRMSLHDMRVDLADLTKRSSICESLLENSDLQIEGKTSIYNSFVLHLLFII